MSAIDQVLVLLEDGSWHNLYKITKESGLPQTKLDALLDFLAEYEFIDLDTERKEAKLTNSVLRLFRKCKMREQVNTST